MKNLINEIYMLLIKENFTIEYYLELNKYLDFEVIVDHLNNKSYKIKIKKNLDSNKYTSLLKNIKETIKAKNIKTLANHFLDDLKKTQKFWYVPDELNEKWKNENIVLKPNYSKIFWQYFEELVQLDPLHIGSYNINDEYFSKERKLLKLKQNLSIDEYLNFIINVKREINNNLLYHIVILDNVKLEFKIYDYNGDNYSNFKIALQKAKENKILYKQFGKTYEI